MARDYHFGRDSQEEQDLVATADVVICEYVLKFDEKLALSRAKQLGIEYDRDGAFKGYCDVEVRSRCRREALRLRNAGTFRTARPEHAKGVKAGELPRCGNCADLTFAPRAWWGEDDSEDLSLAPHTIYDTTPDE